MDEDMEIAERHCRQLMEHFDTVQIFVTREAPDRDGTQHLARGSGNWFARYGQISGWVKRETRLLTEHQQENF